MRDGDDKGKAQFLAHSRCLIDGCYLKLHALEDKKKKFSQQNSHHLFLKPMLLYISDSQRGLLIRIMWEARQLFKILMPGTCTKSIRVPRGGTMHHGFKKYPGDFSMHLVYISFILSHPLRPCLIVHLSPQVLFLENSLWLFSCHLLVI